MGVTTAWPIGKEQPFQIKNSYNWKEIGLIFQLIDEHCVGLVVETGVHQGDFAAYMIAKCLFDETFHYTGIALEIDQVSLKIREMLAGAPQAFIAPGLSYSAAMLDKVGRLVHNSYRPALVFCNGKDPTKEFQAYMHVLRPGDLLVAMGFPVEFSLGIFNKYVNSGNLRRIMSDQTSYTRLIVGEVL